MRERIGEKCPAYIDGRTKNKEYRKKYMREYVRKRNQEDPKFRLDSNMATAIWFALKGKKAGRKWQLLVGYTLKKLKNHLENLFNEKMNWENYGFYWEVDHKRPKSWFKYTRAEDKEFKLCWALKNLQPLEINKNRVKLNNYEDK